MTTTITNHRFALVVLTSFLCAGTADAVENPHWNKKTCQSCHVEAVPVAGNAGISTENAEALCESCHGDRGDAVGCPHQSGMTLGTLAVPDKFLDSLDGGQIVCTTCHDIVYQCENSRQQFSYQNPGFLRDRTSARTGTFCLKCHDSKDYEKLNPHDGVAGSPLRPTCVMCHSSVPEVDSTGQLVVEFNMKSALNDQCLGCHEVRPHPRGMSFSRVEESEWTHLVEPPPAVLENMTRSKAEFGVSLPLDPVTTKIFCATCHNPHGFKVGGEQGPESHDTKHRLRLNNICQACHDK